MLARHFAPGFTLLRLSALEKTDGRTDCFHGEPSAHSDNSVAPFSGQPVPLIEVRQRSFQPLLETPAVSAPFSISIMLLIFEASDLDKFSE